MVSPDLVATMQPRIEEGQKIMVAARGLTLYMTARDGEMPRQFKKLNRHGVPLFPLLIAVGMPTIVLIDGQKLRRLAGLYAIGVVGAITVNLGSCTINRSIGFTWYDRVLFGITFAILCVVELTLAHTKPDALFFVICVLGVGLALRAYTHKRQGLTTMTVTHEVAAMVSPDLVATMQPRLEEGQKIMVAARGITPVLSFALDEAVLRKASPLRALREGDRCLLSAAAPRSGDRDGRMIPRRMRSCR